MEKKERVPDKFIVVQSMGEDLEQISVALDSYELAENFKNSIYNKKNYPNSYILATLKESPSTDSSEVSENEVKQLADDYLESYYGGSRTESPFSATCFEDGYKLGMRSKLKSQWVSVEDRLPNDKTWVLCWFDYNEMAIQTYYDTRFILSGGAIGTPKFWQPLPESPIK